jgi:hypothetical protein
MRALGPPEWAQPGQLTDWRASPRSHPHIASSAPNRFRRQPDAAAFAHCRLGRRVLLSHVGPSGLLAHLALTILGRALATPQHGAGRLARHLPER